MSRTPMPTRITPFGAGPFHGRIVTDRLGHLRITTLKADAEGAGRTSALMASAPDAQMTVLVQVSGTAVLVQDGRAVELDEGDMVIPDPARPYSLEYPRRSTTHVFRFPHRLLGGVDSDVRRIAGHIIGTEDGVAAVLFPFLTALASTSSDDLAPAVADRLAGNAVDLLGTLVAERTRRCGTEAETRGYLMTRVLEHIDRNLGDPDLAPARIAQEHQVSVRYLYRLFEREGTTISRRIRQRRLEEAGRELARRARVAPTVAAVARRWGFVSPAHFSRAFREAYGVSPGEWRRLRTSPETSGSQADGLVSGG
ncbi:helix-turn-helix domain-containing protein [Streptomyces bikiniensis]|uniref:helix-turn-helix domain-containing protein n=1 Tax=Streptomyces bikiniensis TaxID=1896 RepID=UPI0022770BAA|nr:helix-turn-helix domain-containing protein [Streptomyces bikiniensis]